jgi:hypothetical protein
MATRPYLQRACGSRPGGKSEATQHPHGLGVTIHVGEEGGEYGIAEIREIAPTLRPDRIAHGILAAQDEKLMAQIAEAEIVLEICPTSNLLTKALPDEEARPRHLPRLRRAWGAVHDRHRRPGDDAHPPARRTSSRTPSSTRLKTDEKQNLLVDTTNPTPTAASGGGEDCSPPPTAVVKDDNIVGTSNDSSDLFAGTMEHARLRPAPNRGRADQAAERAVHRHGALRAVAWMRGDVCTLRDSALALASGIRQ